MTPDTLARNTAWYGAVTAAGLLAGLLMSVVLARGLGPEALGEYSYLLWLARTLTAVATLGFALATVRYTAEALGRERPGLAATVLGLFVRRQLVATALAVLLLAPPVLWLAPATLRGPLVVVFLGLFPLTLEAIYAHATYGAQRYDVTARVSTLKMTLHLLAAIAAVALDGGILGITVGGVLGTTVACALQRRRALALYRARPEPLPPAARREMAAYLVPLSIVAVLDAVVWDRSEIVVLRLWTSPAEIAYYSLAFGLATRAMLAPQVAVGALMPALATLHGRGDGARFAEVYRLALRAVALVGTPIVVLGAAVAAPLVTLLYGEAYRPVAALLGPLLAVGLVAVLRQVAWSALRATGDRRWALAATGSAALVNVAAAVALVPGWGLWGALAANAAAQLLASALAFVGVARRCRCRFPWGDLARAALAGAAGFALARVAGAHADDPLELAAAAALGLAAVLVGVAVLGLVGAREWGLVTRPLAAAPGWARAAALALAVGGLAAALWGPTVRGLVVEAGRNPYHTWGALVPLFSASLLWPLRRRLAATPLAGDRRGLALLAAGLVAQALGAASASLTLMASAVPLTLAGLGLFAWGPRGFRPAAFPVAFLAFAAPLPAGAVAALSPPLEALAARAAAAALHAAGAPAVRDGLAVHLPGLTLQITEACNGLRFLLAMAVVGAAAAGTVAAGPARRLAVLALALVVGLAGNLVRVATTALLAYYWGPAAATGFFHLAWGKVVYLAVLLPFAAAVLLLRRAAPLPGSGHGA